MLAKLLKHEFKATYRYQCGMYIVLFIVSIIALVLSVALEANPGNGALIVTTSLSKLMAIIVRVAVLVVTFVMAILRYRKNILKDEGYLMHTLPVKKWQLLVSKLITPYVWTVLNIIIVYLSIALEVRDIDILSLTTMDLSSAGLSSGMIVMFVLAMAVSLLTSYSMFYLCLNIGYSMSKDKDLMSFVSYVVIYLINQVIGVIEMFIIFAFNFESFSAITKAQTFPVEYFWMVMGSAFVISIIMCVIYNMISVYMLNKRLNLE